LIYGPRKIKQDANGDILLCTVTNTASGSSGPIQYDCASSATANTALPAGGMIPYFEGLKRLSTLNQSSPIKFRESNQTYCISSEIDCFSGSSGAYYEKLLDATYELVAKDEL
jgi:hypothetical protein